MHLEPLSPVWAVRLAACELEHGGVALVPVALVGVVRVAIHQVIHMLAEMDGRLVAAARAVQMICRPGVRLVLGHRVEERHTLGNAARAK